jgi:N-glycosylase/DNA lyase
MAIAPEIERRIDQRRVPLLDERMLWAEMSCCILSSQVPYRTALAAARLLDNDGVLYNRLMLRHEVLESRLKKLLGSPIDVDGKQQRYRFPVSRAVQIAGAWNAVRRERGTLSQVLSDAREQPDLMREWLVCNVPGLGPKQASMFLRNVGVSYDIAVIDRHVLRYMSITGICNESTPARLMSLRTYRDLEVLLRDRAQELGYALGIVDWAIWIVMRLVTRVTPS